MAAYMDLTERVWYASSWECLIDEVVEYIAGDIRTQLKLRDDKITAIQNSNTVHWNTIVKYRNQVDAVNKENAELKKELSRERTLRENAECGLRMHIGTPLQREKMCELKKENEELAESKKKLENRITKLDSQIEYKNMIISSRDNTIEEIGAKLGASRAENQCSACTKLKNLEDSLAELKGGNYWCDKCLSLVRLAIAECRCVPCK